MLLLDSNRDLSNSLSSCRGAAAQQHVSVNFAVNRNELFQVKWNLKPLMNQSIHSPLFFQCNQPLLDCFKFVKLNIVLKFILCWIFLFDVLSCFYSVLGCSGFPKLATIFFRNNIWLEEWVMRRVRASRSSSPYSLPSPTSIRAPSRRRALTARSTPTAASSNTTCQSEQESIMISHVQMLYLFLPAQVVLPG